jgi:hypothetical protein
MSDVGIIILICFIGFVIWVISSFVDVALSDPNKLEARGAAREWVPHDSSVYTAEMVVNDAEREFGGRMALNKWLSSSVSIMS